MSKDVRVAVVDDHPLLRAGVARSLEESGGFLIVGQGASADQATQLAMEASPDVILLDISMPGGGVSAAEQIATAAPNTKVVMLTVSEADDDIMAALRAGAKGYVLKGVGASVLADIVRSVAAGESYVPPSLAARLLMENRSRPSVQKDDPLDLLSPREEEILRLVADGRSNKEVARELNLQEKTIKHHMTRIMQKLQVRNRTEAAVFLRSGSRSLG